MNLLPPSVAQASDLWTTALEIPASTILNQGYEVGHDISCSSSGNCSAIGTYADATGATEAYVVNETNGTWNNEFEIPGLGALNLGFKVGQMLRISCPADGNCSAGGQYKDGSNIGQAFVVNEVNGTWGSAQEIAGTPTLNTGIRGAGVTSISCTTPGNCSAGGFYTDAAKNTQSFVVNEVNGTWGAAIEVPGTATLNTGSIGIVVSLSCSASGSCDLVGTYSLTSGAIESYVSDENGGVWGAAVPISGLATLNAGGLSDVGQISCSSPGNCAVGGLYADTSKTVQAFVVNEVNGTWGSAIEVPQIAMLNAGGAAAVSSIACSAATACTAGGLYADTSKTVQAFVVNDVNGTWGAAIEVPGSSALNADGGATVVSLSCASSGNCSAGGDYSDASGHAQAFVVDENNGTWGTAIEVPGTDALNAGGSATIASMSCTSDGGCAAIGVYTDAATDVQSFVASSSASSATTTTTARNSVPGQPSIRVSSPSKGVARISIVTSAANHGSRILKYQYRLNGSSWTSVSLEAGSTFQIHQLKSGTTYHVQLRAVNAKGPGVASRAVAVKVK